MLVINYSGNRPQCDRFKFSVNGDNNSQTIKFVLKKQQGDIDLSSPLFSIYFLCQSQDKRFVDKAEIESFVVEGNDIILEYKLLGKHTQFKAIDVGLSFEDENQEVVYKTANATISIQNGIMADQEMENLYPSLIKKMEKDIEETKTQLVNKVSFYYTADHYSDIPNDILEKAKLGDYIFCDENSVEMRVSYKDETYIELVGLSTLPSIVISTYSKNETTNMWEFDEFYFIEISKLKLYKHTIFDSDLGYEFILITTSSAQLRFNQLNTFKKVYDYLQTINCISFKYLDRDVIYDTGDACFYAVDIKNGQIRTLPFDDWSLSHTTDTVREL